MWRVREATLLVKEGGRVAVGRHGGLVWVLVCGLWAVGLGNITTARGMWMVDCGGLCVVGCGGSALALEMPAKRARFAGDVEALSAALLPFVTSVTWLSYDESPHPKVNQKAILAHAEAVRACIAVQDNLAFRRRTMDDVFSQIIKEVPFQAQLDEEQTQDWIVTMSRRFRNLLRHCQQGRVKRASWVVKLFGECSDSPRAKEEARSDDDAVYGFDWDLGVGWKAIAGRRVATSDEFFMKEGSQDADDNMWVRFPNGDEAELAGYLVKDHAAKKCDSKLRWSAEIGGERILVRERADRTPLMALFVGKKQVCNLRVLAVPSKEIAFEVMQKIGQALADKKITVGECYRLREELLGGLAAADEVAAPSTARRITTKSHAAARFTTMTTVGDKKPAATKKGINKKPAAATAGQYDGEAEEALPEDDGEAEEALPEDAQVDEGESTDAKEGNTDARQRAKSTRPGDGVSFFDNINAEPCGFFFDA